MHATVDGLGPLLDIIALLGVALAVSTLLRPLRVSPILGYLLGGMIIGPYGLGIIGDIEKIQTLGEFGIVFLLFTIGLELPVERLKVMRRMVFGLGALQVLITTAILSAIIYTFLGNLETSILIGGAFALSSTALALQLMVERGELSSQYGRMSFSTLLFQDLTVVPLIVVIPLLGLKESSILAALGLAVGNGVLVLLIVILAGRMFMRPLFRLIDARQNPELFTATSLLVVLATAGLSSYFGLSMALGAFLAGLLMADTEYRHQVASDIQPFRGLLLGLFFMSIGMMINFSVLKEAWVAILLLSLGLMLLKTLILTLLAFGFQRNIFAASRYGVMLAQGGEFAFVIFSLGGIEGLFTQQVGNILFPVVTLSMLMTPLYVKGAFFAINSWQKRRVAEETPDIDIPESGERQNHIIIAGYGRVGRTVARVLDAEKVVFVAIDLDHERIAEARARKRPVFYGDATRLPVWRSVGAEAAQAVVVAIEKPQLISQIVGLLRREFPHLKIFVRAQDAEHAEELRQAGATESIPITFQASLELGASVLRSIGEPDQDVTQVINYVKGRYEEERQ